MLLTSHYMRDVEALCSRVLVISHGRLIYDGLLAGITEQFTQAKIVKLHFDGDETPQELERYGEIVAREGPMAELRVDRSQLAQTLNLVLDQFTVLDISVQDPPLEQVIARVFEEARERHEASRAG
jgi:ABC-2 type transport system ATP-binding protein